MPSPLSLLGRVALVTGAAQGIGFETARILRERGATVALVDLDATRTEAAAQAIGGDSLAIAADVTDAEAMRESVAATCEQLGGLDVVVANAGVAPPPGPMSSVDPAAFERTLEIDLLGVWRTVQPALPQVLARRGHVVVVASVYAFVNGMMAAPYAAAKAGVEQLGRALRAELSAHGAGASVAYFGFIDTQMVRDALAHPVASHVEELFPAFVTRRLQPADAGAAIADGIERRSPRIILPRWWRAYSVLRGIAGPLLDARLERDERFRELILEGERRATEAPIRIPPGPR